MPAVLPSQAKTRLHITQNYKKKRTEKQRERERERERERRDGTDRLVSYRETERRSKDR